MKSVEQTEKVKKYLQILLSCNKKSVKQARKYRGCLSRLFRGIAYALILLGVLMYLFIDSSLTDAAILAVPGFVIVGISEEHKKAWEALTLNGTLIHPMLK